MVSMDVFNADPFKMVNLTASFERIDYRPQLLGSLNLFRQEPSRTRTVFIERRNGALNLVPTTPIGAPPSELDNDKRDARPFNTVRIAKGTTIYAEELQNIRAMGSETEMMQVQGEVLRRGERILEDIEMTWEHMRLGAIKGVVVDADGSSVINDWFSEFNIAQPTPIDFDLDNANPVSGALRIKCHDLVRSMARSSKGAMGANATVHALCGDEFYDKFITHPDVERTYLNYAAAADLREGKAFDAFTFGGITWHNYRGTDDESTVAVASDTAHFFPVGATDMFQVAFAPSEFMPYTNTLGRPFYSLTIPDRDRQAWTRLETYSYPLFICSRPEVLRTGVIEPDTGT